MSTKLMNNSHEQTEVKSHIEIEGLILTPAAIDTLKRMQNCNNDELLSNIEAVTEAILLLFEIGINTGESFKKQYPTATENMRMLTLIRGDLKKLLKP